MTDLSMMRVYHLMLTPSHRNSHVVYTVRYCDMNPRLKGSYRCDFESIQAKEIGSRSDVNTCEGISGR